jgi:hypothetical protein
MTKSDSEQNSDILGLKGFGDSMRIATQGIVDGAGAFLGRVCLPAAEELGLALRDRVSSWRAKNACQILSTANDLYTANGMPSGAVNPRLIHQAIDQGSWIDDEVIQGMWAGLLCSAVSQDSSDENLIFLNLLAQLSGLQVRILLESVTSSQKYTIVHDLVAAQRLTLSIDQIQEVAGSRDIQRIDRELDHLREIGLIGIRGSWNAGGGIDAASGIVDITPTPMAIHLYVRAQGFTQSPALFFNLEPMPGPSPIVKEPSNGNT